ncbi:MAG: acylphosphatase [Candidatus Omnitrophica bacterium]|nr:acylphosphatase [Candidatus Omnitrophota bacterium]
MKSHVHVYFSGKVQGVGFRYTAEEIARSLGICGWVSNMRDGRVEIVGEAEKSVLLDFIEQLKSRFSLYIRDTEIEWLPAQGEYKDFDVRF